MEDEKKTKTREARARRALYRQGYRLFKTPARSLLRQWHGVGYQIANLNNVLVAGCCCEQYEMTLEDVEDFARSPWDRPAEAA